MIKKIFMIYLFVGDYMTVVYILLILICLYIIWIIFKSFKKNEFGMFWYNFLKGPLGLIFKLYYPFKVVNKNVIPNEGPIIFCGNHIHIMDQCLPILVTKRSVHYMAKIEYFNNPKTRWFFKMVGCIPVNREIHDDNAKNKAIEVLNKGLALGIFPEGTRNKTKELLQPFKFGAVSMAKKTNATIVPFVISGTYKFRTKDLKVTFGAPFKVGDMELDEANQKLYNEILKMIKENRYE